MGSRSDTEELLIKVANAARRLSTKAAARSEQATLAAAKAANLVVIPCRPQVYDLETILPGGNVGVEGGPQPACQRTNGRHYILRATEVRLHPAPWDEQMVMRVRNLIAYEKLERVLRELMEQLLTKTHVSIDQGAVQQIRVPSVSEYSQ